MARLRTRMFRQPGRVAQKLLAQRQLVLRRVSKSRDASSLLNPAIGYAARAREFAAAPSARLLIHSSAGEATNIEL